MRTKNLFSSKKYTFDVVRYVNSRFEYDPDSDEENIAFDGEEKLGEIDIDVSVLMRNDYKVVNKELSRLFGRPVDCYGLPWGDALMYRVPDSVSMQYVHSKNLEAGYLHFRKAK